MGVTYEEWLEGVRAEGWRLYLPGQTWEPVACVIDGRMTYGVNVRRWDGPGPEPPPTLGPGEGPAE
jgi:hypothetical protein